MLLLVGSSRAAISPSHAFEKSYMLKLVHWHSSYSNRDKEKHQHKASLRQVKKWLLLQGPGAQASFWCPCSSQNSGQNYTSHLTWFSFFSDMVFYPPFQNCLPLPNQNPTLAVHYCLSRSWSPPEIFNKLIVLSFPLSSSSAIRISGDLFPLSLPLASNKGKMPKASRRKNIGTLYNPIIS